MEDRKMIAIEETWSIDEMFTEETFEATIARLKEQILEIKGFQGRIGLGDDSLARVLQLRDAIRLDLMDLICYSHMKLDENTKNATSQTRMERSSAIAVEVQSATAFIEPELLGLDAEGLVQKIESTADLGDYDHYLKDLLRQKAHILSKDSEMLMAMLSDVNGAPQSIFGMLDNADMTYGSIEMPDGTLRPLTKSSYIRFLEHPDQVVRQRAFESFYKSYEQHRYTLAATYMSSVKKDVALAKVRGYKSAMAMSLSQDNIPESVYDNLVAAIRNNIDKMHRYVALRKRALGLEELHIYDVYAPLVADSNVEIDYRTAYQKVLAGLEPLGETYREILITARDQRWIDVYETEGKRGGAYSWGTYRSKPYILLNYQKNLNDVFTLAHELGHSVHSYFSRQAQVPSKADYSLFVAEVASTVNEAIMMRYLLDTTQEVQEKRYLLNHFMEQFKGTVFRQTMFAEFERDVHMAFEAEKPMNMEGLCSHYFNLNAAYFGPDMILDLPIQYEWSRIPHFYNAFYVYKYATGFSAAMAISKRILEGVPGALEGYFDFLKAGGSMYPLDALKLAGVDMTRPETVTEALAVFGEVMDQFEALMVKS